MRKLKASFVSYFLLLIFLASSWSLLIPKFFRVHDYTHAGRIVEMSRALHDGHFPVRWTENFGYGYGMPLFEFYGPLPFYVGAIVFGLGLSVVVAIKALYLIANLGTIWGGYKLGEKLYGRAGGLIVSAALTLAPYRAVNLFVRGALNEAWAIMFLPWILLGLIQTLHQEKRGWLVFTLSLAGLFLSHNITTMIFAPVLLVFALGYLLWMFWSKAKEFFRKGRFRWLNVFRVMGQVIGGGLLAIGLSSFYLVPAFLEKNLTQVEHIILSPYFDYHLHFLYIRQFFMPNWGYGGSAWGLDDQISFFLGYGQWFGLIALGIFGVWQIVTTFRKKKRSFSSREIILFFTVSMLLLGTLYMSLLKSQGVWDAVPLFKFIQFPWRWLSPAIVFLSLLLGSIAWLIPKKTPRTYFALLFVVVSALGSLAFFRPEKYLDDNETFYYTDASKIRTNLSSILPDYISANMKEKPSIIPDSLIINTEAVPEEEYSVQVDRVQEKLIQTHFKAETPLSLSIAHYPDWRAEIDSQRWTKETGEDGNIVIVVPPGDHLVSLQFKGTAVRRFSDWASAASWFILVLILLPRTGWKIEKKHT